MIIIAMAFAQTYLIRKKDKAPLFNRIKFPNIKNKDLRFQKP